MVTEFRRQDTATPVVLMGYANPIERMGQMAFAEAARKAGVDGVLVVDYPPEEITDFAAALNGADIATIFLLAPSSEEHKSAIQSQLRITKAHFVLRKNNK